MAAHPAPRTGLPRTRSFRGARPRGVWWLAAAIGAALNGGLVIALSQVSHLRQPAPPAPPLTVRRIDRVDPEPPPPPPERPREEVSEPNEAVATVALPTLELPATTAASDLVLPAVGALEPVIDLPLLVPAFAAMGQPSEGLPEVAAAPPGPPAFDTPAQREGALDLDRHYPRAARTRGITGTSRIRVHIDARGRVGRVEVLESTPPGVFDGAAERVGRDLRFRPAQAGGKPVASLQDTTIEWTIR